jgi:hypothetical protein
MSATVIFILYIVSTGNLPDFTSLAAYQSREACDVAAAEVNKELVGGEYPKTALCLSSDTLNELADKNNISGK